MLGSFTQNVYVEYICQNKNVCEIIIAVKYFFTHFLLLFPFSLVKTPTKTASVLHWANKTLTTT